MVRSPPPPPKSHDTFFRDGETAIKIKFSLFGGGGGAERKIVQNAVFFFMGNVMTIRF